MEYSVATEARAILDEAAILGMRRGKFYVGVEYIFEALLSKPDLLPEEFTKKYMQALTPALNDLRGTEWQGVAPVDPSGEVCYTPRAQEVVRESARLAQHYRRGAMSPAHLMMVILQQETSDVCRAVDESGLDRATLCADLHEMLLRQVPASQGVPGGGTGTAQEAAESSESEGGEATVSAESFTSDLTEAAQRGELSKPFGRDTEIYEIVQVLMRKEKNNVILLGEPGVGKTKIIEGIAVGCADGSFSRMLGQATRIIELNITALMAGTQLRGTFESKILALLEAMEKSDDAILFIDEIHLIMGAGATDGDALDMANMLKPALGRGQLRCIGATTPAEYRKSISKDPAIERRFQTVTVEGLSPEDTHKLLKIMKGDLERHHGVSIGSGTMSNAVILSERYLPRRQLPDKAIDIVDQACARFHLKMVLAETNPAALKATIDPRIAGKVTPHDVRKVVSAMTSIPLDELNLKERAKLTDLEERLNQLIIGQERAVGQVVPPIRKSKVGMSDPNRPDAVLFFLGPTGVGKTQLAKELAETVFGSTDLLYTFDMSEFAEEHSVTRLLGAPPGYVGHEKDGLLYVYMLNTPYSIILFDEIEKAHPAVYDVFLPMLDEGRLMDSRDREISFKNAIILFTSNVAAEVLEREDEDEVSLAKIKEALSGQFRPEFLNRVDGFVPFYPLRQEDVRLILRQMIDDIRRRLLDRKIGIRMYESTYAFLGKKGFDSSYGARELRRAVERFIADPISELLLQRRFKPGDMIEIRVQGDRLSYEKGESMPKTR